ncbi:MAG: hypothetical protein COS99_05025 [Candidatus Omnitrophica bacterium CG07_land_8_20_14_0_80_42_15]|uniref:YbbR domain pair protein n=1 Tax=Candidatus Aquitaenariimonas noxiae TaxID=1974741 RepID=A0A2J0KSZ8_9BACT|nr:MAG: hypothetical protein COS99_05025 [Candidatus Omnitrophica bacterium CG07_land_8_20_14_0_80_42_15]
MKKIRNFILSNIYLKVFSLVLAVTLWFYMRGELSRITLEEEMGLKSGIVPYRITAKIFPVALDITGKVASNCRIIEDKIVITPAVCSVMGPEGLLNKIKVIKTMPIDISEYTKNSTIQVSLRSPAMGVRVIDRFVTVSIPIVEKIEKENINQSK